MQCKARGCTEKSKSSEEISPKEQYEKFHMQAAIRHMCNHTTVVVKDTIKTKNTDQYTF